MLSIVCSRVCVLGGQDGGLQADRGEPRGLQQLVPCGRHQQLLPHLRRERKRRGRGHLHLRVSEQYGQKRQRY